MLNFSFEFFIFWLDFRKYCISPKLVQWSKFFMPFTMSAEAADYHLQMEIQI